MTYFILCSRCNRYATEQIVTIHGELVHRCFCGRMWNRTNGHPMGTVYYWSSGTFYRLSPSDEKPVKVKDPTTLLFCAKSIRDTRERHAPQASQTVQEA